MSTQPMDRMPARGWVADDSAFGARLALVRQRMGWGNVKVAALACGLPAESWRTWERDNVTPRDAVSVARKVSAATGCDLLWLLRLDSNQEPPGFWYLEPHLFELVSA